MTNPYDFKVFVDCGAPSLYNKLSRQDASNFRGIMGTKMHDRKYDDYSYVETEEYIAYRQSYIDFIKANRSKIDVYSNLDVINNPELTYENQKILEKAGLKPIPVFHLSENDKDLKFLRKIVDNYGYMALGGLVPNPTSVLKPMLDEMFKKHLCDKEGYPIIRVHGFACTSYPLMERYPWASVDSATCRKLANFGSIVMPDYSSKNPIKTYQVSSRTKRIKEGSEGLFTLEDAPCSDWLQDMSKQIRKAFDQRCEQYGMSIQQLGDSIIQRVVWNYLIFSEVIQKKVPMWPWSMTTRKTKSFDSGVQHDYMTFYFAGILSKSEEEAFWNGVNKESIYKLKGTLRSFFYKKNAEYVIGLKNEE